MDDIRFILRKRPQDAQPHNLLCDQRGLGALPPTSKRSVSVKAEIDLLALWVPQSIACQPASYREFLITRLCKLPPYFFINLIICRHAYYDIVTYHGVYYPDQQRCFTVDHNTSTDDNFLLRLYFRTLQKKIDDL